MGLGDEIMALGRVESYYERTGLPASIVAQNGTPRDHPAWHGNPAWRYRDAHPLIDGGGYRPYIKHWKGRRAIYNMNHRPRAGRIHYEQSLKAIMLDSMQQPVKKTFALVAPDIKNGASVNKAWGRGRWENVIRDFPVPVFQLLPGLGHKPIKGAIPVHTPTFHHACAVIEQADIVLCNEGGSHHMAASMGTPAVVIFGSFIPPQVTGYDFHCNIAVDTDHGYCGNWNTCADCQKALEAIHPDMVRDKAIKILQDMQK